MFFPSKAAADDAAFAGAGVRHGVLWGWWLATWRAPAAVATPGWNAAARRSARQRRAQGTTRGVQASALHTHGTGSCGKHVTHTHECLKTLLDKEAEWCIHRPKFTSSGHLCGPFNSI